MNQALGSPVAKTCSGEERECGRKQRETRRQRANDFAVRLDLNGLRDADARCGKDLGTLRVAHVWVRVVRPSVKARQADHEVATGKVTKTNDLKESVVNARAWRYVHATAEPAAVRNGDRRRWSTLRRLEIYAQLGLYGRVSPPRAHGGEPKGHSTRTSL